MARQITFKKIIISGLCIYICLTLYFLLSLISTDKGELKYIYDDIDTTLDVDFVKQSEKNINDRQTFRKGMDINSEKKSTKRHGIPNPAKPQPWKTLSLTDVSRRFRLPSIVNQNFTEIAERVFVYSAFLDDRGESTYIRLVAVAPSGRKKQQSGMYCIFNNREETELVYYETCENHLKKHAYYMVSCPVPQSQIYRFNGVTPMTISPYKDATADHYKFISVVNNRGLSTSNENRVMGKFAVCVPPLFGKVNVLRLVEFIELTRLLGSTHFIFYTYSIADDILRVLRHYRHLGVVTHMPWYLPVGEDIWYKGQSAAVGDCLLRNMYINEIVAFNDIDEFIIPKGESSWIAMVDLLRKKVASEGKKSDNIAVFRFQMSFFRVPKRTAMANQTGVQKMEKLVMDKFVSLSQTERSVSLSKIRTKMLAYPLKVFELGIHHLSKQLKEGYFCLDVEPEVALLHHYRKCDNSYGTSCLQTVEDSSALRFKYPLANNTIRVLKNLKYSRTILPTKL